jgi:hypothetical protein
MKNLGVAIFSILASASAAANNNVLSNALEPWEPLAIIAPDSITIVLNESRVTDTIYEAVIETGVCLPLWLDNETDYLLKVNAINVLNKFKAQGYVLEKPLETCKDMGESKGETSKIILMGNTHVF